MKRSLIFFRVFAVILAVALLWFLKGGGGEWLSGFEWGQAITVQYTAFQVYLDSFGGLPRLVAKIAIFVVAILVLVIKRHRQKLKEELERQD